AREVDVVLAKPGRRARVHAWVENRHGSPVVAGGSGRAVRARRRDYDLRKRIGHAIGRWPARPGPRNLRVAPVCGRLRLVAGAVILGRAVVLVDRALNRDVRAATRHAEAGGIEDMGAAERDLLTDTAGGVLRAKHHDDPRVVDRDRVACLA